MTKWSSPPACLLLLPLLSHAAQRDPSPTLTVGTRLVQIDVLVRDKNGPVTNLTRDDFTILDQGRPQQISVFSTSAALASVTSATPLSPGAISNRQDPAGRPLPGATIILFDLLNTQFDLQGYMRHQMQKYLESLRGTEQVAIYALGKNLTVLQDFTDDPQKLIQAIRNFNPKLNELITLNTENMDAIDRQMYGDMAPFYVQIRADITSQAVARIAQHMSGMPGRKSLIWLSGSPGINATPVLRAANINLYPVLARSVGTSGVVGWLRDARENGLANPLPIPAGNEIAIQRANAALAASMGGAGFNDVKDLARAVQQAAEDATHTYTLGFYPAEETLDRKFHVLTVNVARKTRPPLEIRYRPGYLALPTGVALNPAAAKAASIASLFESPLTVTAIGLTARSTPAGPAKYNVDLKVDLHDLHFEIQGARHLAELETAFQIEGSAALVVRDSLKIQLTDDQLRQALDNGLLIQKSFDTEGPNRAVRIVVRDLSTGSLGSLRVPLGNPQK